MAFFNLPFSVKISNEAPIDGDRYVKSNQSDREQLITDGRAHEGLQVFQEDNSSLYILKTLGATPSTSVWEEIGTGGGSTSWSLDGNDLYNTNPGNVSIGGTPTSSDKLAVYGRLYIVGDDIYTDSSGNSVEWNVAYNRSISANPTFSTSTGVITFTQEDATTLTVNLDGRYVTPSSTDTLTNKSGNISQWTNDSGYITSFTETDPTVGSHIKSITTTNISNWNTAYNNSINTNPTFSTSSGTLTFTQQDATTLTVNLDGRYSTTDTNYYANSLGFNTTDGVLTLGRSGLGDLTVDLDGRYLTTYTNNYADSLSYNSSTNVLTLGRSGLGDLTTTINTGTSVNFSTQYRIPFMNAAGDNFIYSANITFNGGLLDITGSGDFTNTVTASDFVLSSDIELKENIINMNDIDNTNIDNINIINFNYKNDNDKRERYGVIAQDLEKYYPELIYENKDGYKQVSYIGFILSKLNKKDKQIKELQSKINNLEKRIK